MNILLTLNTRHLIQSLALTLQWFALLYRWRRFVFRVALVTQEHIIWAVAGVLGDFGGEGLCSVTDLDLLISFRAVLCCSSSLGFHVNWVAENTHWSGKQTKLYLHTDSASCFGIPLHACWLGSGA